MDHKELASKNMESIRTKHLKNLDRVDSEHFHFDGEE